MQTHSEIGLSTAAEADSSSAKNLIKCFQKDGKFKTTEKRIV